jgi:large subunit ribosomal protein L29
MNPEELRRLTDAEIAQKLTELKEELFNLRFQMATGQTGGGARVKKVRRDIARAKTILRERELGLARGAAAKA